MFPRVARFAKRLDVSDVTSSTFGHRHNVVGCEFPTLTTTQTLMMVLLAKKQPLFGRKGTSSTHLLRASIVLVCSTFFWVIPKVLVVLFL